jgi:hypothetical protein
MGCEFRFSLVAKPITMRPWKLRDFASAELRFPHVRVMTPAQWMKESP